ncbi:hypothetical protein PG994_006398 [Apiospora phragmitis]|uniref:Uncharacterized protein n=1 Tax=Apiospora phragmitis TaxID=2905665 RepID=A0ABR1VEY4_9PEZI
MPGPNAFKNTKASGPQANRGKGPPPKLVKRPRIGSGSLSQPASQGTSAQGFLPPPAAVNNQLDAAGFTPFGFRNRSSSSNPGQPHPRSRPGSGNMFVRPGSRQGFPPNPQAHGAPIQVYDPDHEEDMHSQGPHHFNPYQQPQYYGQLRPQHSYQQSQPDGLFYSRHHQPPYDDQFHSQHSQQQPQYVDWFRSQNSQSLPPAQFMGQMSHSPGVANFDVPREVHSADSTQQLPEAANASDFLPPRRPPVKDYIAEVRKRTASALEAVDTPTERVRAGEFDTVPIATQDAPTRSREPIQRPARELRKPKDDTRAPEIPVLDPQRARQDKPTVSGGQNIIGDEDGGRVTRSRAKKVIDGQTDVSFDRNNHDGKASDPPTASLPAPITEESPQQPRQTATSKRSVATTTDPSNEQPPSKKLKEISKKEFQKLLKADDLMSVALENGITSPAVLQAAMLGRLMAQNEKFSEYVDFVLDGMD